MTERNLCLSDLSRFHALSAKWKYKEKAEKWMFWVVFYRRNDKQLSFSGQSEAKWFRFILASQKFNRNQIRENTDQGINTEKI